MTNVGYVHHADEDDREMSEQDRPPLFGTWRKAYAFAIAMFAIEVALLYAFTLRFS